MATKIGRSFSELDEKIKQFNSTLKDGQKELKEFDNNLKLHPGSVDTAEKKFKLLASTLQTNTQKLAALRDRQKALTADFEAGAIKESEYNNQLKKTAEQIAKTEIEITKLTEQLRKKNQVMAETQFEHYCAGLKKAEDKAKAFSRAALVVVGALTAVLKSAIDTGDALYDTATKYHTSVESIQLWQNRLTLAASDSEAYTKSLQKLGEVMKGVVAGSGGVYLKYLNQLGLGQEDLKGKTNAEVFDLIYKGLRNVTDEAQRSLIAQSLLGQAGLDIATIAGQAQEAINGYDNALIANGLITTEQAAAADEAANKWAAVKQQFQATNAELLTALMPTFEALTNLLKLVVIPVLDGVSAVLGGLGQGGQTVLLLLLMLIIFLPKIIALVKSVTTFVHLLKTATYGQAAATMAANAAAGPWLGIIIAISLALIALISIIGIFNSTAKKAAENATSMLNGMDKLSDKYGGLDADLGFTAEKTYDINNERRLDIQLDVNATGDGTQIDQENADKIADSLHDKILTDLLNNELGGIVR